jgi:glycosyltransferase involved in cell wall biosynthesis
MRVLHLNNERTWRGGERQTLLTAQEQRRAGIDAQLACRRGSPLDRMATAAGVPTLAIPSAPPVAIPPLARLARGFDVLHCHTGRTHSMAAVASLVTPRPLIVSRRVHVVPSSSAFNRWKYARADRIVCASRFIARLLQEWGVSADRLSVAYEAVPTPVQSRESSRRRLRELTGIPDDRPVVGNVAALVGHKDHATLLRAARIVATRRPDVAIVVVGDGDLRDALARQCRELGLDEVVHFTGFVERAERLLPAFDVFTLTSSAEGLGTIVLDAAGAGIPIAVTDAGGLPEVVLHDETGLVVPVADDAALAAALLRLLEDRRSAVRLAAAARARFDAEFGVEQMVRRYVETYRLAIATRVRVSAARLRASADHDRRTASSWSQEHARRDGGNG